MAAPRSDRRRWSGAGRRRGLAVLAVVVVAALALLVANPFGFLPKLTNPFGSRTVDRSQPAVLKSVTDLQRFVAAAGTFQLVVDLQTDAKFIPSALYGNRSLFVAYGTVDVYVDLGALTGGAVAVSADRTGVTLRLPAPAFGKPNIDHEKSYLFGEQRGILNRIQDVFGGDPNRIQQLNTLAEQKITAAATAGGLADRARTNTTATLTALLRSLGFTTVTVTFPAP